MSRGGLPARIMAKTAGERSKKMNASLRSHAYHSAVGERKEEAAVCGGETVPSRRRVEGVLGQLLAGGGRRSPQNAAHSAFVSFRQIVGREEDRGPRNEED